MQSLLNFYERHTTNIIKLQRSRKADVFIISILLASFSILLNMNSFTNLPIRQINYDFSITIIIISGSIA